MKCQMPMCANTRATMVATSDDCPGKDAVVCEVHGPSAVYRLLTGTTSSVPLPPNWEVKFRPYELPPLTRKDAIAIARNLVNSTGSGHHPDAERLLIYLDKLPNHPERLVEALQGLLTRYVELVSSGDCGSWNVENESAVALARMVLRREESS